MTNMKKTIADAIGFISIGVLIMVGTRAAEWMIPKPEMRVVFCLPSEDAKSEVCRTAAELLERGGTK